MFGMLYQLPSSVARARANELLDQFDLADAADRVVKTYSGGMRRRLDLGSALIGRPKLLFLDEPTTGLDPRSRLGMWEVIRSLVREGATLLLTTQYLEVVVHDRTRIDDARRIMGGIGIGEATLDEHTRRVTVPSDGGATRLATVIRDFDEAGIDIDDIGLRRPTLDDVFLSLTGHAAVEAPTEEEAA
jgi:ABC-2 type transport system ATP-binding protein